ncbi:serine hydrolase [Pseudomonas daroniae]|uniref:beta-lactamase n=1 Tax=Phytopseudomonas daroniae TaxID=2487519 RepID=A0A4Q9QN87_9GAMM|nr:MULTISPECIES: serine hydrolase [Pseudomonas]TBU81159.1 serine hydrolase [Pseudomonas daroniae]TBU83684.1 serine hydrolase [Pseudomonas sp. FRB 228]TBU89383.1 serine hydrolase [Pseudomonas daroniae]
MKVLLAGIIIGCAAVSLWLWATPQRDARFDALQQRLGELDEASPGQLGVYLLRPADGRELRYHADRPWYLGSATKAAIAIAVLQEIDDGKLQLDQQIVLEESDRVDGSGGLVWEDAGASYSVSELIREMLQESDNTAADMLIRAAGEDQINGRISKAAGNGFGQVTTLLKVRHELYGHLHPAARSLENNHIVEIAAAPLGPLRVEAVANALELKTDQLDNRDLDEAYRRYYDSGLNSATLIAYGQLLGKLVSGDLLSRESQERLYDIMGLDSYDAYRLEAGLAKDLPFIQKTGTQQHRACHIGVANPQDENALVIVACAEGLDENDEAGKLFEQVGEAIQELLLTSATTEA